MSLKVYTGNYERKHGGILLVAHRKRRHDGML